MSVSLSAPNSSKHHHQRGGDLIREGTNKRYTHNWWHTALFYLEKGDADRTLDLFDQRVWGFRKEHTQVPSLLFPSLSFSLSLFLSFSLLLKKRDSRQREIVGSDRGHVIALEM